MGFGFSLIGIPLLLLLSVTLLLYFLFAQEKKALYALGIIWGLVLLLIPISLLMDDLRRPIHLTKVDFVGDYRIDTTFYPGRNARWQYDRFGFRILGSNSIIFVEINDKGTRIKVHRHPIKVSAGPPSLWTVTDETSSRVFQQPPMLYRGHTKFYYVFDSERYGNMFFRKVKE
ncbi:MAG: hypothetical protein RLZZ519_1676 [Bacteroidota bacterium]|jgi:hypothetical protein